MLNIKKNFKKIILAILAIVIFNNIFLQTLNADLVTASQRFVSCFESDDSTQNISLNLVKIFGPERIVEEDTPINPMGTMDKLSTKDFTLIIEKILNSYITETSNPTDEQLQELDFEPEIPLNQWIKQIITISTTPRILVFCALIYLGRLNSLNSTQLLHGKKIVNISKYNIYRLFLTSIILASKMHECKNFKIPAWDTIASNHYGPTFLNAMEKKFLKILDYKLLITKEELQKFLEKQYLFVKNLQLLQIQEEEKEESQPLKKRRMFKSLQDIFIFTPMYVSYFV